MANDLAGRTVLLVEDEFLVRLDLSWLLEEHGATVVSAGDLAEGLGHADGAWDVALLDVRLPDGDVFPLAEKLAERSVPLVFHSGHARLERLQRRFPGATILAKPSRNEVLVRTLASQAV
ncbi:response regulator receiver domain-containing protein [Hasllibacter halocynthiae]|uniref:Response regulator receiver domain-containing protein n=1 Tax=Hasllibacter halocynthiae TaxID=595589 RepID=A0A2T0X9K1_9RHOB|nr:response regulator [Hasllibacter halocynthiae]PRY95544.1 response regulator receiver domain-containing protein [Hasllibacter halocynthiae]